MQLVSLLLYLSSIRRFGFAALGVPADTDACGAAAVLGTECKNTIMSCIDPFRRRSVVTAMGIVTLALAIFVWVVQYKLSLYDAPVDHATTVLQAKLLSPKERSMAAQVSTESLPETQASLPVVLSFIAIVLLGLHDSPSAGCTRRGRGISIHVDRHATCTYFSFKPPPA